MASGTSAGTGFLSIYGGFGGLGGLEVGKLLIAYEGGGPSTLRRGGDSLFLFSSKRQLSPSALAMEVVRVSSVEGSCPGINSDPEVLGDWNAGAMGWPGVKPDPERMEL